MTKLSKDEKKEAELALANYKNAYCCKRCGKVYGSDLSAKKENGFCPAHSIPFRRIK